MPEPKSFEDQIKDLLRFFKSAETNHEEVTYEQIQEWLVSRSYDTIVWYANNFWTWFLSKKGRRGRYQTFVCHDLDGYPEAFFVAAHQPRRGKYFYHFGKALDASRERAELRKRAKELAGQQPTEADLSTPPKEAEQEFPEELHIADNEAEEGDDLSESTGEMGLVATREEPAPPSAMGELSSPPSLAVAPVDPMTTRERIFEMFDFSRKNREAVEQLRLTVETLTRTLTETRDQLSREASEATSALEGVKQALEAQTQRVARISIEQSQLRSDVVGQVQAVEQQVQTIEQTLTREQRQFREQITGRVEELAEEIHQLRMPPDFSSISASLANQIGHAEETLIAAIKQLPTPPDFVTLHSELESSSKHLQEALLAELHPSDALPQLSQMATDISNFQQYIKDLASHVHLLVQNASISPNGQAQPLQTSIQHASVHAHEALTGLENAYRKWLELLEQQIQEIHQEHQELQQEHQELQQRHGKFENRFQKIRAYISPDREEPQDGGGVQETNA